MCKVENCEVKVHGNGYCKRHYQQMYRHGRILEDKKKCIIEGCNRMGAIKGNDIGVCKLHRDRKDRTGSYYAHQYEYNESCKGCGEKVENGLSYCGRCQYRLQKGIPLDDPVKRRENSPESWLRLIFRKCEYSGDCLLWKGSLKNSGHGQIQIDNKNLLVHRVVYAFTHKVDLSEIKNFVLHHECHVENCVSHMKLMTASEHGSLHRKEQLYFEQIMKGGEWNAQD